MPLYDFDCASCNEPFEALVAAGSTPACPHCGSETTRRRWSPIAAITTPLRVGPRRASASKAARREPEEGRKAGLPPDPPAQEPPDPKPDNP